MLLPLPTPVIRVSIQPNSFSVVIVLLGMSLVACEPDSTSEYAIQNAPPICDQVCDAEDVCESQDAGISQDARDYLQDECIYGCAYRADAGALIIERALTCPPGLELDKGCIEYVEQETPAAWVPGYRVVKYLKCLASSGLMTCKGGSYGVFIEDAAACSSYDACIRHIDYALLENATWDEATQSCNLAKQFSGKRSYYLDLLW
jgi:hypothetical protein